jgi:predicted ATPase
VPTSQARQMTAPAAGLLLEREAEVATLAAMVDAARAGEGRLVAIEGSAGIGKTRLLAEVRATAVDAGLDILAARAGELEREFAFGVVRQLFESLLTTSSADERAELLSGAAAFAAPLFDQSQLRFGDGASGDASFATLHGLYWLAANIALRRPLLLAVDDMHWADAASLRWLGYLARRLEGLPLLLAVATRPRSEANESAMLDEVLADPAGIVVRPGPLGTAAVAALIRDVLAAEPEEAFVAAAETASGGNPLFVRALLDAVKREQLAPTAANAARLLEIGPRGRATRSLRSALTASRASACIAARGRDPRRRHRASACGRSCRP